MNKYTTKCFELYCSSIDSKLSNSTIISKSNCVKNYLESLEKTFNSFENYDISNVYSYVNNLKYASQTKSGVEFTLREFFNVMYLNGITNFDGRKVFPVIFTNKRDKIPSYYAMDEFKEIISLIDIINQQEFYILW